MACDHEEKLKCIVCAPHIWHPPQEEIDAINRRIYQKITEDVVEWNRLYRMGEPVVPDFKFDMYEASLKKAYPNHPYCEMVDHSDEIAERALAFIPETKQNPILGEK